ncbi:MAG: peptidoglycan DD-metalloendopeptidase family protein [Pseudomonadota bacterium]
MSQKFSDINQNVIGDDATYCPVVHRERSTVGVAASLAVLLSGAGFLTYAVLSAPAPAQSESAEAASNENGALTLADTAPIAEDYREADAKASVSSVVVETAALASKSEAVASVLEESRAARQSDLSETDFSFGPPRLKPTSQISRLDTNAVTRISTEPFFAAEALPAVVEKSPVAHVDTSPEPIYETTVTPVIAPAHHFAGDIGPQPVSTTIKIKRGETFVDALKRVELGAEDRNLSAYAFGEHYNLRRLKPGQEMTVSLGWPNQTIFQLADNSAQKPKLLSLSFRDGHEQIITVTRTSNNKFAASAEPIALTTKLHAVSGRIEGSLYLSAKSLGVPDNTIASLANAFAYDVDFQREIFGGDEFEILFEAKYDDRGDMVDGGEIQYARLNWRGRSREKGYYLFASSEDGARGDFYDATGQSAKRLLMKTPIDGARLSSRFGTRKHPILGYRKAHKGVDFAARHGTPIKAAGDGVIERANRYGSFGNYIRIRHANGYKTAYAHLKGFARGIQKGKRVRQGDIIGYVGTTGRSTGPHLHYEVHLNNKAVNPQKLKIATGKQLKGDDLKRFKLMRTRIDALRTPDAPASAPLFAQDETPSEEPS